MKTLLASLILASAASTAFAAPASHPQPLLGEAQGSGPVREHLPTGLTLGENGSERTPLGEKLAEDGFDMTPLGEQLADDGFDRTPMGQRLAENGSDRTHLGRI